ncbi:O-methyltransferase [Stutzerimonas urumqiensis]|uniref:O-methyltransferase n=1 Tax=Stutzerimonas urumqiensis TaxID=638269 RepID=UPI003BA8F202
MTTPAGLERLKAELERFGREHDASAIGRGARLLNITRDTGQFLALLVRATRAADIVEVGTSNGYSTLWLAEATIATGGRVVTVERAAHKVEQARRTFERSGLAGRIELVHDEAAAVLARLTEASVDLLFLDSERSQYLAWWPRLRALIRPGGLLVVDNAVSHATEMASFVAAVEADDAFTTSLVPVGKGEFLAVREPL